MKKWKMSYFGNEINTGLKKKEEEENKASKLNSKIEG